MSKREKAPAFPIYTKDYDTDEKVILMDLAQEGAFGRLLRHQWREGSIPADVASLAVICRVPLAKMQRVWAGRLASCFEPLEGAEGRLVNRKAEKVRQSQNAFHEERAESGRRGAEARKRNKEDSSASGSATGSAVKEPSANGQPAVAVAVPLTAAAANNGSQEAEPRGKVLLSREGRLKAIAEGNGYLDALERLKPGMDRSWEIRQHSKTGSGASVLTLEQAKDEHLLRTVHALRDTVERLQGSAPGAATRGGLLTPDEYHRQRGE